MLHNWSVKDLLHTWVYHYRRVPLLSYECGDIALLEGLRYSIVRLLVTPVTEYDEGQLGAHMIFRG
jgi:hypothetical protein